MALADFNASLQQTFKEQMAVAAGLARADSGRVTLAVRGARRRLLAGGVALDVIINMPDATSANAATSSLSQSRINTLLAAAGLPAATVTSAAALSSGTSGTSRACSRAMFLTASGAVLGLLGAVGHAV